MTYEELLTENNKYKKIIAEKELTIATHLITIANMKQQIDLMKKYIFGSRRETSANIEEFANGEQCDIFCEEKLPQEVNEEIKEAKEEVTAKVNKKRVVKCGIKRNKIDKVPTEVVRYEIENEMLEVAEGKKIVKIGEKFVREEVKYVLEHVEKVIIIRIIYKVVEDVKADNDVSNYTVLENDAKVNKSNNISAQKIISAYVPTALVPHSFVTPSLLSHIIFDKYYR